MYIHTVYLHPAGTENPPSSFLLDRGCVDFSDYSSMINKHQVTDVLQTADNDARSPYSKQARPGNEKINKGGEEKVSLSM